MTPESAKRVIVRHQTSLGNILPIAYRARIQQVPGVEYVAATQWFGGIYKDTSNFFAQFAVDPEHFFDVWPEVEPITPDEAGWASLRLLHEAQAEQRGIETGFAERPRGNGGIFGFGE